MKDTAAILGGGVIGGGWAARFLLSGWDVRVFDPDPQAERKLAEVLANARAALPGLSDFAPPPEGRLTLCKTLPEAVAGAAWIQESVPERLELKRELYQAVQAACDSEAIIGSSTSGFKPSELQEGAARPAQIVVAHPFNPVYLLPLVELVSTDGNPPQTAERAKSILTSLGMVPLHLKREIDAHLADRLLEAVWREALWLVRDGVATTTDIDEAIRLGFGLRWAQMGLFETYRIAGGEAGMRHFIAQFGPCLSWPWTRLTDVPELTDELVEQIASQSDAQSGAHTIRELERIRDRNLVAILRGLKTQNWGAGAHLAAQDARQPAPKGALTRAVPLDWTRADGSLPDARLLDLCEAAARPYVGEVRPVETRLARHDHGPAGAMLTIRTRAEAAGAGGMILMHDLTSNGPLATCTQHFPAPPG